LASTAKCPPRTRPALGSRAPWVGAQIRGIKVGHQRKPRLRLANCLATRNAGRPLSEQTSHCRAAERDNHLWAGIKSAARAEACVVQCDQVGLAIAIRSARVIGRHWQNVRDGNRSPAQARLSMILVTTVRRATMGRVCRFQRRPGCNRLTQSAGPSIVPDAEDDACARPRDGSALHHCHWRAYAIRQEPPAPRG